LFFFFQAEDGIRDRNVTGVQTCALPILQMRGLCDTTCDIPLPTFTYVLAIKGLSFALLLIVPTAIGAYFMLGKFKINKEAFLPRSEERRVGKEGSTGL